MSYILEALKKSEKKRQGEQGSLAHLATQEPAGQEPQPPRRPLWPLLVGIALVINAGVLLFIFWPSTPQLPPNAQAPTPHLRVMSEVPAGGTAPKPDRTPASVVSSQLATTQKIPLAQTEARLETRPTAPLATQPKIIPTPAKTVEPISTVADTVPHQQEQARTSTRIQTTQATQAGERKPVEVALNPVPAMEQSAPPVAHLNELPLSFRSQLPEMHMSVHVYTGSPQGGVVRINENMLRPGDYLDNRLLLEEITPGGAVFSYLGQWFLLPRRH
ncbi:MAG: general secretion pathway protein GspB [Desulfuromonadaceae bacterium]|nr:general secretion pathway protein GspB [Desulfuromonadaceae bacterium]